MLLRAMCGSVAVQQQGSMSMSMTHITTEDEADTTGLQGHWDHIDFEGL